MIKMYKFPVWKVNSSGQVELSDQQAHIDSDQAKACLWIDSNNDASDAQDQNKFAIYVNPQNDGGSYYAFRNVASANQPMFRLYDYGLSGHYVVDITRNNASSGHSMINLKEQGTGNVVTADKNNSGSVYYADQDANNASACYGLRMSIVNTGAGLEYAFRFDGSEIVSSAVGGSQDKKIRVSIAGTDYFIPLHTA